jgi:hypothetical protein
VALEVVYNTAGGFASYAMGGPGGVAVGAAAGPLLMATTKAAQAAVKARLHRSSQTLAVAAQILNRPPDQLVEDASADDGLLELMVRVLDAGGRAILPQKIEALGRVLADAMASHERDYALALARALTDIEAPHVRVLSDIETATVDRAKHGATAPLGLGWSPDAIESLSPKSRELVDPVLAVLSFHGLIRNVALGTWNGVEGNAQYITTELGSDCLSLLHATQAPKASHGEC